jgi:pimeloyl-ACP methyl ester carboxylesterase
MPPIDWSLIEPALWVGTPMPILRDGFGAVGMRFRVPLKHGDETDTEYLDLHADLVYSLQDKAVDAPFGSDVNTLPKFFERAMKIAGDTKHLTVYLCGGPGDGNPAFANPELNRILLAQGSAVLYLDYRGTGRSSPVKGAILRHRFGDLNDPSSSSVRAAADYLSLFRQDHIAADLEAIRLCLDLSLRSNPRQQGSGLQFTLLGQSFGGWIALTYLSFAPASALRRVYMTGGMPPAFRTPDDVYSSLFRRVERANEEYYARYPQDVIRVRAVTAWLAARERNPAHGPVRLPPDGDLKLSARGFMTMGRHFGRGPDGLAHVHDMVDRFYQDIQTTGELSRRTLRQFATTGGAGFRLHERPLYGVLHEAIYCAGPGVASRWAAQRVGRGLPRGHWAWLRDDYDFGNSTSGEALYFSGEMIYEFMLQDAGPELEPFLEPARELARRNTWSRMYDEQRLAGNTVPVRPMVYPNDMFVDYQFSLETAARIWGCRVEQAPSNWPHASVKSRTHEVCSRLFGSEQGST